MAVLFLLPAWSLGQQAGLAVLAFVSRVLRSFLALSTFSN